MRDTQRSNRTFLTAQEVPQNLLRLKRGDVLRWTRPPRVVERVGYRKTAADFLDDAESLLRGEEGRAAVLALRRALYGPSASRFDPAPKDLDWYVARRLAARDRLGGPERGLVVRDPAYLVDYADTPVEVHGTRVVRLGVYYPPSGGGEDYEDGGLEHPRSVVLVLSDIGEVISGDLRRA